ncbi:MULTISPECIES: GtrA family protein [Sphingobacterium]|uniref:GtrA family protein n=1 Tax=Sphingobacterium TaxID=28453 RepID=UPI00257E2CB4|nr:MULTISPECIES: GtrA family protein [Sphingobacterium]
MILLRKLHLVAKDLIITILDYIHKILFHFIPIKTFRYASCGGGVAALNIIIYFISYNFIFRKKIIQFTETLAVTPHIAAFIVAFLITFPLGFYLNMYVVSSQQANRKRRIHLFRYFLVVLLCIVLNYICIKFFVEKLHFYPTPSALLTTVVVSVFSYVLQQVFSFRKKI